MRIVHSDVTVANPYLHYITYGKIIKESGIQTCGAQINNP